MTAINPSNAFQARCSVIHIPPAEPVFLTNRGFSRVRRDTSLVPNGGYILTLDNPEFDFDLNALVGTYNTEAGNDLGVLFFGHLPAVPLNNEFSVVRFQVIPGNTPIDGNFQVAIINLQ